MKILEWESSGHPDAPGDQNADSDLFDHAYWSLGDGNVDGAWYVELIVRDDRLDETDGGVHLGYFDTEAEAKASAQSYENDPANPRWGRAKP